MSADVLKQRAAAAALEYISEKRLSLTRLGIGTGSTVNALIPLLVKWRSSFEAVVASSEASARQLEQHGIRTSTLEAAGDLTLYIDGADEIDDNLQMLKGGGGAHTREKILASCAKHFVAIMDAGKRKARLGGFAVAVEVIPLARGLAARKLAGLGGNVRWREGFVTDNGNWILDVRDLDLTHAAEMERRINSITGVVENGIFALRRADVALVAGEDDITRLTV